MNVKRTFFLAFFLISYLVFAQKYKILYKVEFKPQKDSLVYKTEYMSLEIQSKTKSVFQSLRKRDSLHEGSKLSYLQFTIIQNNKDYEYYGNFNDLYFAYNQPLKTNWLISNKTSEYNGYKVQEAEIELDGRKWTALFTNNIPINTGPYKFSGLPGLILKVYSEDGDYSFEMVELLKQETTVDQFKSFETNKYIPIKKEKIETFIQNFIKDPGIQNFKLFNNSGDSFTYSYSGKKDNSYKQMNQFINKIITKYNNPIDKKIYILVF